MAITEIEPHLSATDKLVDGRYPISPAADGTR